MGLEGSAFVDSERPYISQGRRVLIGVSALLAAASAAVATAAMIGASVADAHEQVGAVETKTKPSAKTKPGATLKGTGILRWNPEYGKSSGYERYAYVLVSRQDARSAARLPGLSLAYMSGTSIQRAWSTGVTYTEAQANGWLLKDTSGRDVMNVQYGAFIGDIGNPDYQNRFVENVSRFVRSSGVDGIFLDDVVAHPGVLTRGVFPAKYPTPEAWEAAMVSFVSAVGRALKAQGHYVLANAIKYVAGDKRSDTGENTATFWRLIAPSLSGLMSEFWLQNPNDVGQLRSNGSRWNENWDGWQRLMSVAQDAGADFFSLTYGSASDVRAMRYVRGSFLLSWDGHGGAVIYRFRDADDPHHPVLTKQLGTPLAPRSERAPGVWQRRYTRGIVIVNTTSAPVTLKIGGTAWTIGPVDALMARPPRT